MQSLLCVQASRPRYARSSNLHSGLRPSLVFKVYSFSIYMPVELDTVEPDSNGQVSSSRINLNDNFLMFKGSYTYRLYQIHQLQQEYIILSVR